MIENLREIKLSYGWIECVGHADRACYDLQQHAQKSGVAMVAAKRLDTPLLVNRIVCEPNKQKIGPRYKGDQKAVIAALEGMSEEECAAVQQSLEKDGIATVHGFEISPELVTFKSEKKTISEMKYTPSVIEPSYGIGRLIHSVLEHSFSQVGARFCPYRQTPILHSMMIF